MPVQKYSFSRFSSFITKLKFYTLLFLLQFLLFLEQIGEIFNLTVFYSFRIAMTLLFVFCLLGFSAPTFKKNSFLIANNVNVSPNVLGYSFIRNSIRSSQKVFKHNLNVVPPVVSAKSFIIYDLKNNKELESLNKNLRLPPASTTKVLTALVALEHYKLSDYLNMPEVCTLQDSQRVGFLKDERLLVKDLIYSMLIVSGGDSACALEKGKDFTGVSFIKQMNKLAYNLGMNDSIFDNSIGYDSAENKNLSTANDLVLLTKYALKNSLFTNIVKQNSYNLSSGLFPREIANTNLLLKKIPGSVGVKTGKTEGAGEVLIYRYFKDNKDLLIVVMGSKNRFEDTEVLLKWTLENYFWSGN